MKSCKTVSHAIFIFTFVGVQNSLETSLITFTRPVNNYTIDYCAHITFEINSI